jgi:hypothetical protein
MERGTTKEERRDPADTGAAKEKITNNYLLTQHPKA